MAKILYGVVLFAKSTLSFGGITTDRHCPHSDMKQLVICLIRTNDKIAISVIRPNSICVMNEFLILETST